MPMWNFITQVMLYPALVLLLLVLIPKPRFIEPAIVRLVDGAFNLKFQNILVWKCFWICSTVAIVNQAWCLRKYATQPNISEISTFTNHHDLFQKATRWRCERNFWISLCTSLIYWNLFSHRQLMDKTNRKN